jgi:flagellin
VIKIGTNTLSLHLQRNLDRSTKDLSTASERLSSGLRINKASDDAAGLAISMTLNAGTRIFNQGVRNLNDGLSAANIAESAMGQLEGVIGRIEELATQASNGTFSDTQRQSMQEEVTQLQKEWNRIIESTTFNGTQLLTGSNTRQVLQGGIGVEGTLALQYGKEGLASGFNNSAGETTRVSTSSSGAQGNGDATFGTTSASMTSSISADGRYVVFRSAATKTP